MKKLFTLLFLTVSLGQSQAQTITGADMETWKSYTSFAFPLERPDGWFSSDSLIKAYYFLTSSSVTFTARTSKSTTVKNAGLSSAMLVTPTTDTFPTILANSNISFNLADIMAGNYKFKYNGGTPVTKRILFVHAYTQHSSVGSSDEGVMNVMMFKKGIGAGGSDSMVGAGNSPITASSSFKKTTTYISYVDATIMPDRLVVSFVPTKKTTPPAGTTLYVDDVTISDPSGIETPLMNDKNFSVFPNPAVNNLHISTKLNQPLVVKMYSTNGKLVLTQHFQNDADVAVAGLAAGNYIYVISGVEGRKYYSSTFTRQ